ncbi:hypothetical protein F5883DRAFT_637318 [Diaporthe sp. PMI_573]|nr:hypothetical protein F5883DRAFT_637318 [Diaporthaceae sp. PMI_573]
MVNNGQVEQVQALLPPALLEELSTIWFQHIVNEQDLVVPSQESMMHWFRQDEAFDQLCSAKFRHSLEQIRSLKVTGETIINAVQPSSPLDWIRLIILLDQMPRNIYRGEESRIVFTVFDPVAQHIAQAATAAGVHRFPVVRYRIGHRLWFNMPFMHSEDRVMHQKAVELIESMANDINRAANLQDDVGNGADAHNQELAKCIDIITSNRDAAVKLCESQLQFEVKHKDIIDKFGRYPHRNPALGRHMTTDEQEFLDGGGDTFGS